MAIRSNFESANTPAYVLGIPSVVDRRRPFVPAPHTVVSVEWLILTVFALLTMPLQMLQIISIGLSFVSKPVNINERAHSLMLRLKRTVVPCSISDLSSKGQ